MNNIQGYGLDKPSVRTTQAPGGNSSIQFGNMQEQPNITGTGRRQVLGQSQNQQSTEQYDNTKTSVKVRNPPGGKSQITFG